jgi:hypothetical protein
MLAIVNIKIITVLNMIIPVSFLLIFFHFKYKICKIVYIVTFFTYF